jgi:hypothetical protein
VVEQVLRVVFSPDRGDAGAPQCIGGPVACSFSRGRIADVERYRNRRVAGGAHEVARLTHVVDIAEYDAGSAFGEIRGNGLADAMAARSPAQSVRRDSGVLFGGM